MDRVTLFSLVLAETVRPDKESELPGMLLMAEAKISRELRCEEMSDTVDIALTNYSGALPDDFLGVRAVYDADGPLQQVGLMEFRTSTRQERTYAIERRQILSRCGASLTVTYFARPAAISADADTTAVLDAHPDLYVALLSFYVFKRTQDLELADGALQTYNDSRDTLNEVAERQRGAARLGRGYSFGGCPSY